MPEMNPKTSALVLIDLQNGIVDQNLEPRSSSQVVSASKILAERFRAAGAVVVLVNVDFNADFALIPPQNVDKIMPRPQNRPENWPDLVDGLAQPGDIRVTKRQWGAFYGTDLELQLRRRGISTIVLGGLVSNFGVESTARDAWERGFDLVICEDLTAAHTEALHRFAYDNIFPRLSRVTTSSMVGFG